MNPPSKVFKNGRVCIVLSGRMAGKKAVVLSAYDNGSRQRSFGHALVVGIEKSPRKVTKKMTAKEQDKRSNVKVFLKYVNYSHLMPTRYVVSNDVDAKTLIGDKTIETKEEKAAIKKSIAKYLKERFLATATNPEQNRDMVFLRKRLRF